VLGLIATLPASLVFKNRPWRTGVAGTVWNGEVGVAGGIAVRWHWAPLRSLTSLGFAADWNATGPDTDLGGRALAGLSSVTFDKVSGSGNASLLQAIQPNLPFSCDFAEQIEMEKIVVGGSAQMLQGRVASDAGSCRPKGAGAASAVPPLLLVAEKIGRETRIRVTPAAQRLKLLVSATLQEDGAVKVTVTRDGADALPFLGVRPGMTIEGRM
jgi:hypothetical protein